MKKIDRIYHLICCVFIFHDGHWTYSLSSLIQLPLEVPRDIDDGCKFGDKIREYYEACNHQGKKRYQVEELISRKVSFSEAINTLESLRLLKLEGEKSNILWTCTNTF